MSRVYRLLFTLLVGAFIVLGVSKVAHIVAPTPRIPPSLGSAVVHALAQETPTPSANAVVHALYFYQDCKHCREITTEVLAPLQREYGERLDVRMLNVDESVNYELLVHTEEFFEVAAESRGLPTLVVGSQILIGEDQIRQQFPCWLDSCLASGGAPWPPIPGLEETLAIPPLPPAVGPGALPGTGLGTCADVGPICPQKPTIYAAYFYQVGCQKCSRAETIIAQVHANYPQLIVEEFNVYDDLPLARWLGERLGRGDVHTPALFIGDDALIGEEELTAQNLEGLMAQYAPAGAARVWADYVPGGRLNDIPSVLTIVVSGLVDGLNPCAFATLIFFIAYLSANGRRGREILAVGGAFTLGVFLAYMLVGLGLYKAIDLLQDRVPFIKTLSPWVYVLTALFCLVLAVFSFRDFIKARRGQVEDMSLSLPEKLRSRTRFIIREGQRVRAYVASAFVTGLIVSLLELACTGQLYLPTIIYMTSVSALRSQGVLYLLLYNLCFILPLVVVFALTYLGTSSMQLGLVLKRRTAAVKLGTAALFVLLAAWLILTAVKALSGVSLL